MPHLSRRALLHGAALLAPNLAWGFEREGGRKILVFSGNQGVPVLDPHVRYDWSTRMVQQGVYDALLKYVGDPPRIIPWLADTARRRRRSASVRAPALAWGSNPVSSRTAAHAATK